MHRVEAVAVSKLTNHHWCTGFVSQHLVHQKCLPQATFTPEAYTKNRLHWSSLKQHLLHQTTFTPKNFTPDTVYTRRPLHQFLTSEVLHQEPFTPHQIIFTPKSFKATARGAFQHQESLTPKGLYTRRLLHQKVFQRASHQKTFAQRSTGFQSLTLNCKKQ